MVKESNSLRNKKLHSSKPYDVSNSFVKKVTSRVTNLLPQPAWLSKWFTASADNGHDRDALNSNDSGSEEDDKNIHVSPAKKTKIPLNQAYPPNSFQISPLTNNPVSGQWAATSRSTQNESISLDLEQAGPSGINTRQQLVSSTPNIQSSSAPRTMLVGAEHKMNGDDQSESSESTSGCSSLVPQANRQFQDGESVTNSLSARRRSMDEKLNFTGHLQSPRSLFSDRSRSRSPRLNSSLTRRRPSFNVSSFSSPILEKDKTSIKNRIVSSPFYSGRTMYGGASAYRRSKDGLFSSNETLSQKRCGVQVKPVNSASDNLSSMSTTARRILESLEQFSTPVLDAKRIPLEPSTPPLSGKRKRLHEPDFSPGLRLGQAPRTPNSAKSLTCGLTVPTVPDLLKMRHREKLQDSLEAARLIAVSSASNVVSSSVSSSQDYKFGVDNSRRTGRHGGKIRSREKELEEESVEKVDLPNISLPVTSLPKFDFVVPPATSTPPVNSTFKFASPITVTKSARTCLPVENFTFSKPLSAKGDKNNSVTENVNCIGSSIPHCPTKLGNLQFISGSDKPLLREKDNKNTLCKNNIQNSELCFGIKAATELKTGSVMDILNREPNSFNKEDLKDVSSSGSTLLEKFKPAQGTWECGTCMIRNKSDATRCAACETSRISAETSSNKSSVATRPDKTEDMWECSSCHVRNLYNVSVCKKCSAARGEHAPSAPKVEYKEKSVFGFGNKFKPASDTWECGTCLVRNPDSSKLCQACETKRPVLTTTLLPVSCPKPTPSRGFGDKFKKPKGSWDCPDCMLQNKEESPKCVACERAKPGTETKSSIKYNFTIPKEASGFKFGIDKAGENSSLTTTASSVMQGFKFGETKVTVAENFSFGVPANVSNTPKSDSGFSSGGSSFPLSTSCTMVGAGDTSTLSCADTSPHSSALAEEKRATEVVLKKRRSSGACEGVVDEKDSKSKEKDNSDLIRAPATSTENAVLNKKVDAKLDSKKVTFSFGTSNFTSDKPNFSTKTECAKPSFSFGAQSVGTTTGLNFGSVKAAAAPKYSFITPHSTSVGSSTSGNATTIINTSAATLPANTAGSLAAAVCSTATSTPTVTNNAPNVTSASTCSPFTFGSSNVSPFRSSGLNFGQSAVSTTASPISFGTALKTTVTPVFSFNSNTSQAKPFTGGKEPSDTTTPKKQVSNFGSVTDTAPVAVFGPQTTTVTTTTTTVPSITSSSLPSFTSTTSTPGFTSGTRSTVPVFGTPSTSSKSSTTTTVIGFGSVTTPNFSTGFSSPGEQKQPSLSSKSTSETFSFGSNSNANTPSLGQTPSFSFGAVQNDQIATKGFNFGTASGSTASATHAASSGFGFAPNNQAPSQIGATFNFGSSVATTSANSSLFGSANNGTSTSAVFGAGSAVTPFGANANTPSTTSSSFTVPTFNFGTSNSQPSSNLFVFAPNQTSGSTNLPLQNFTNPASTFNFSQTQSSMQNPSQPALPTFNPNVRPSFNFTKGETPLFTAAAGAAPAPGPQRRIKKAVRRTHQR